MHYLQARRCSSQISCTPEVPKHVPGQHSEIVTVYGAPPVLGAVAYQGQKALQSAVLEKSDMDWQIHIDFRSAHEEQYAEFTLSSRRLYEATLLSSKDGRCAQFFLYAQELIILGKPL